MDSGGRLEILLSIYKYFSLYQTILRVSYGFRKDLRYGMCTEGVKGGKSVYTGGKGQAEGKGQADLLILLSIVVVKVHMIPDRFIANILQ